MGQMDDTRLTRTRPTNELESDQSAAPITKRVLLYGWDSVSMSKVRLSVDASGLVKIDPTAIDNRYLKLDQTTEQEVVNGAPRFYGGIRIKAGEKLILDA